MGKKVAEANVSELNALLNGIIALIGIKVTAEDKPEHMKTVLTVLKWIQSQYATWTIEEIKLAYELLVSRKLGIEVFRAIDPNYFSDVMSAYLKFRQNSSELQRVYKDQLLLPDTTQDESTDEEIDAYMESEVKFAVQTVQRGELYGDLGSGLFDWLEKKGRIAMSHEQATGFWNRAIEELKWQTAEKVGETKPIHPSDRKKQVQDLASLINGIFTKRVNNKVLTHAKTLALNHYLIGLIPEAEVIVTASKLKSTPSL